MRARIRAAIGLLAAVALVIPGPALAQAPQAAPAPAAAAPETTTLQLSLDDTVKRALENNTDIAVGRFDPQLSEQSVFSAQGYYDPQVYSTLSHQSTDTKGTSAFSGGEAVNTKTDVWNFGGYLPVQTGGSVQLDFNNNKRDTNNAFSTFNPVYNSGLTLSLRQPLLRNFSIDQPRYSLRLAKKNREISDVQFRQTIIGTVATAKDYYYQLIYFIDALSAARKSLQLAQRQLQENEIRVKVGTMAPLDVVFAQSEVASREEAVIVAENNVLNAEDNLKRQIFPENDPAMWNTRVVPSDRPTAEPMPVDAEAAIRNALENRTDMIAARKSLERNDLAIQFTKNQLLPDANLFASYGGTGAGGTQLDPRRPGRSGDRHDPRRIRRRCERGLRPRLPDLADRREPLVLDPQPQRQGLRGLGPHQQGPGAHQLPSPRDGGGGRGAHGSAWRRVRLQARAVDQGRPRAPGAAAGRRGEEVRGRHVDELPRHAGPARPG